MARLISLAILADIFTITAGFSRSQNEGSATTNRPLVSLNELDLIAKMFPDCNLYIYADGAELENLDGILQPHLYYTNFVDYMIDHYRTPGSGVPFYTFFGTPDKWAFGPRSTCKAEFAITWRKELYRDPKLRIHDLFLLESKLDSSNVYQVLLHRNTLKLPRSLYRWDITDTVTNESPTRRRIDKIVLRNGGVMRTVPYTYHIAFGSLEGDSQVRPQALARGQSQVIELRHRPSNHVMTSFELLCHACVSNKGVKWSRAYANMNQVNEIVTRVTTLGTAAFHQLLLETSFTGGYVCIMGLSIDSPSRFLSDNKNKVFPAFMQFFKKFSSRAQNKNRIQDNVIETRGLKDRNDLIGISNPESVLFRSLVSKHRNITLYFLGKRPGDMTYLFTKECLFGPGLQGSYFGSTSSITVAVSSLTFVSCSNVTQIPQIGILQRPFDTGVWVALFLSSAAVCSVLLYTMETKESKLKALEMVILMIYRLLLENFQDLSHKFKRWRRAFSCIMAVLALCAVTITNGYRGAVTSDLVMAPSIKGPTSFDLLLKDGNWSFIPHYRSRATDEFTSVHKYFGDLVSNVCIMNWLNVAATFYKAYTEAVMNKEARREEATVAYLENSARTAFEAIEEGKDMPCPCTRTAFVVFRTSFFVGLSLPDSCRRKMKYTKFVVAEDTVLPGYFSWSSYWARTGVVFHSIQRFVEGGIYKWYNEILRQSQSGLVTKNQEVVDIDARQSVEALRLRTPLVSISFSIWGTMLLVSAVLLFVEFLCYAIGVLFVAISIMLILSKA